jgi:hypothetical protein
VGALCLAQGLSKGVLWLAGRRTPGYIAFQENTVSSRGATWVRYTFTAQNGQSCSGTAMTAAKGARFARVEVAYLPFLPSMNMPAQGGYAALMGIAWSLTGLVTMGVSQLFKRPAGTIQQRK